MRLGLLGPSGGDVGALGRAAEFLLNGVRVHRAIYLGNDGALDRAVAAWARKLVGDDPSDDHAWRRAAEVSISGTHDDMISDRVAVLIHDKALLDEEDILAANLLCFGKSDAPLVKKIGTRWFVTPGPIGCAGGGLAVLDDEQDDVVVTIYDAAGKVSHREALVSARTAKLRVQGDA